jgi:hypothetical protein
MWDGSLVLSLARGALEAADARLAHEHAVHGLDAMSEGDLQAELAAGFAAAGVPVVREQPYPRAAGVRGWRAERERCDLVLLPAGAAGLADPVEQAREHARAKGTLFESLPPDAVAGEPGPCPPGEAFWLEVKVVGQFVHRHGVPGPNTAYAGELVGAIRTDLSKLSREPGITHAGLLIVLFTAGDEVARHDVTLAVHRAMDRGVPVRSVRMEGFEIPDRIGNTRCRLVLLERSPAD